MDEAELGSWSRVVTSADGTSMTHGYHSKNATFRMRNSLSGALLYYKHLYDHMNKEHAPSWCCSSHQRRSDTFGFLANTARARRFLLQDVEERFDRDSSHPTGAKRGLLSVLISSPLWP